MNCLICGQEFKGRLPEDRGWFECESCGNIYIYENNKWVLE